jgi:hypothetical protein
MTGFRSAGALATLTLVILVTGCAAPAVSPSAAQPTAHPTVETARPSASVPVSMPPSQAPGHGGPSELTWERIELLHSADNGAAVDVEAAGPGFVALGFDGTSGSIVWTSPDGRAWTAVAQPEWGTVALASMAEVDGRLIAVGRDTTDIERDLAMVWISDDGISWRRAEGGPDLEGAQLIEVVATDDGFLAIGGYPRMDAAAVFTSSDGEVWTRAASVPADAFDHAFMWSVADTGLGLVAVGWRRNTDEQIQFDPAFWTSADGVEWKLAATPDGAPGTQVRDVIPLAEGAVAVGDLVASGGQSFAWTAGAAGSWELVGDPDGFDDALISDLTAIRGGVVAVGSRESHGGMWISADGSSWSVVDDASFADAYLVETLDVDGHLIVAGATQRRIAGTESYTSAPAIWYGATRP